jgi:MarR family transcriptional regulator, 2-MHQ and catechol-resistance regulon repressor
MKNRYRGSRDEVRALNAYLKLMRAAETITGRIHRHLSRANLTISQFGVLEALYHLGPMTQVEIGMKILKSSGNMTLVIDNLEKRGLVRRERSREDRRFFTIHLTAEGKKLISGLFPSHAVKIMEELGTLTPAEQEELGRLCRKLGLGREIKDEP